MKKYKIVIAVVFIGLFFVDKAVRAEPLAEPTNWFYERVYDDFDNVARHRFIGETSTGTGAGLLCKEGDGTHAIAFVIFPDRIDIGPHESPVKVSATWGDEQPFEGSFWEVAADNNEIRRVFLAGEQINPLFESLKTYDTLAIEVSASNGIDHVLNLQTPRDSDGLHRFQKGCGFVH